MNVYFRLKIDLSLLPIVDGNSFIVRLEPDLASLSV